MPNASASRIPGYRRHRPTGQAVVTLNGKDFYLGRWNTMASRERYDRLIAEWTANRRQLAGTLVDGPKLIIAQFVAQYDRFARSYYVRAGKPSSEYQCMRLALRIMRRLYSRTPVVEFGPLALKAVREKMIDAGWARTFINHQINRIRRAFKWGVENELFPPSVLHGLQAVAPLRFGRTRARESDAVKPVPNAHTEAGQPL
jgi:hypothetical protein